MEQIKIVGSFESYASGIDFYSLYKVASLLGIKCPSKHRKAELITELQDTLENGKATLRMFSRNSRKAYKSFSYYIQVLKHFEEILGLSHDISEELARLWDRYMDEI